MRMLGRLRVREMYGVRLRTGLDIVLSTELRCKPKLRAMNEVDLHTLDGFGGYLEVG